MINSNDYRDHQRHGCIPIRVGADQIHRVGIPYRVGPARLLPVGARLYLTVQPASAHPEIAHLAVWRCNHPHCSSRTWKTKAELLMAHESAMLLSRQKETHVYYAAVEMPGDDGPPARAPVVILLSDSDEARLP